MPRYTAAARRLASGLESVSARLKRLRYGFSEAETTLIGGDDHGPVQRRLGRRVPLCGPEQEPADEEALEHQSIGVLQFLQQSHGRSPVLLPCPSNWRPNSKRKVNRPAESHETVESSDEKTGAGTNRRRMSPLPDGERARCRRAQLPSGGVAELCFLRLGRGRGLDRRRLAAADVDLARLHRLGDLALQRDAEQAVGQLGAADPDEIGKLEAALEGAVGDPHVQEIAVLAPLLAAAAGDGQHVLVRDDLDILALEAGHGKRDPVAVLAELLDVEGRIIVLLGAAGALQEIEQPIEADG